MGLKQDIVIVNEFSQPLPGGGSSLGATPGAYVTRYMARELATETVAPIRRSQVDDFLAKPYPAEALMGSVRRALDHRRLVRELA